MLTNKVKKRISFLGLLLVSVVTAVFFILKSLSNNILYFKSPTEIKLSQDIVYTKKIRVGGMVKKNSIDIILKKENVLIGKTNLDISKNILDLFNKNVKKISVN